MSEPTQNGTGQCHQMKLVALKKVHFYHITKDKLHMVSLTVYMVFRLGA